MSLFGSNNYGADTARENISRYGFQGVYQKFLQGESTRMKDEESKRIMRLATNLVPGQSNLRVNLAQQGLSGGASNVLAAQQRNAGMDKAMETGFGAQEQMSSRLDQQFLGMTGQNEAMRFGATQDLMKADQMKSEDESALENSILGGVMGIGGNMLGMGFGKMLGIYDNANDMGSDGYDWAEEGTFRTGLLNDIMGATGVNKFNTPIGQIPLPSRRMMRR